MNQDKQEQQKEFFINRLRKNERQLRKWKRKENITCYRIYDKDIPEIPFVVDIYHNAIHAAEYRDFQVEDEKARENRLKSLLLAAGECLDIAPDQIFFKFRKRQKGNNQYEKFSDRKKRRIIQENGLNFIVNLTDYLDTGLFLDHRITRKKIQELSFGKRVLNLFAYTGSFSVYAANGSADATVTVDLSNTYLNWAAENFRVNSLYSSKHLLVREDALVYLEYLQKRKEKFDLIILDPPTFSNSKMMNRAFDIQKDHVAILNSLTNLLEKEGELFFSTNYTKFQLNRELLNCTYLEDISLSTIPPDFRNKKIHYCFRIKK